MKKYGWRLETTIPITKKGKDGLEEIQKIMKSMREKTHTEIAGIKVKEYRDYQKGVDLLIKALARLDYSDYKMYIIGMGQMKDELQKLVSTYDLTNNVEFLGYRDNISDLINSFDFLVFLLDLKDLD